jgi:spermidine/putrescine transport system substrate-binding protein
MPRGETMTDLRADSGGVSEFQLDCLTRRSLFHKGAGLAALGVLPGLIAACGGGGTSSNSTSNSATADQIGGTINFLGFQGSDLKGPLKQFYKENNIQLKSNYIGTMSDIAAKFAGGGGNEIDIVEYSTSGNVRLQQSGVDLQPLDLSRIPNWKYVEDFVNLTGKSNYSNEGGEIVSVPYAWGALGITYDSSAIAEPKSWKELRDPKYKGKLTLVDDPSTNYDLAAEVLGFSAAEMSQEQLEQVNEFMKEILVNAREVSPTFGDMANLIGAGEVEVIFGGWSAINTFAAEAGNPNVKTNLKPEEGGGVFVEQYGIAANSSKTDTVYAIMNEVIQPKVDANAAASVLESSVAEGSQRYQPRAVVDLYVPESDYESYFKTSAVSLDAPAISNEFVTFGEVTEAWTQVKAEV